MAKIINQTNFIYSLLRPLYNPLGEVSDTCIVLKLKGNLCFGLTGTSK